MLYLYCCCCVLMLCFVIMFCVCYIFIRAGFSVGKEPVISQFSLVCYYCCCCCVVVYLLTCLFVCLLLLLAFSCLLEFLPFCFFLFSSVLHLHFPLSLLLTCHNEMVALLVGVFLGKKKLGVGTGTT